MAWRVTSRTDARRWAAFANGALTADGETLRLLTLLGDGPVRLTPVGPAYSPSGPDDETAVFLRARNLVPAPAVTGDPPSLPPLPPIPPGAVS